MKWDNVWSYCHIIIGEFITKSTIPKSLKAYVSKLKGDELTYSVQPTQILGISLFRTPVFCIVTVVDMTIACVLGIQWGTVEWKGLVPVGKIKGMKMGDDSVQVL